MSLFQCQTCGARENTATGSYWLKDIKQCSECATGKWHNEFPKVLLPMGMFVTNNEGNLQHKENGDTNIMKYALNKNELEEKQPAPATTQKAAS